MGHPEACCVAVDSIEFNIYRVSDAMAKKGWSLSPLQFPSRYNMPIIHYVIRTICFTTIFTFSFSIHLTVTYLHTREGVAQRFIEDMRSTVEEIMKSPKAEAEGAVSCSFAILRWFDSITLLITWLGCYLWHGTKYSWSFDGDGYCKRFLGFYLQPEVWRRFKRPRKIGEYNLECKHLF